MNAILYRYCEKFKALHTAHLKKAGKNVYGVLVLFSLLFFSTHISYGQFDIPEKPSKSNPDAVYDYIGLLSTSQKAALEKKIISYSDTTSTQIVIAIVETINGETIGEVGARWGQKWEVGNNKKDNGILILVAKNDRQLDINTGYGIESIISDRDAEQIINRIILPEFKKGNFYGGLDKAINALIAGLEGNFSGTRPASNLPVQPILMFIFFIVILIILSRKNHRGGGRNGGNGSSGGSLLDVIILSNMGRGGFGGGESFGSGGSFGGGGFGGGFGGGGFGGGGASGSW